MLCIVTQFVNKTSETFIRDHINHVAPGRTVVICESDEGTKALNCPVLVVPHRETLPAIVPKLLRRRAHHAYSAIICDGRTHKIEKQIGSFLRTHGVEAVLIEYLPRGAMYLPACKQSGARVYVHAHGADATSMARSKLWRMRYRRIFWNADGVFTPSSFIASRLEAIGCPAQKLMVSPCGVDPTRFTPGARSSPRILAVGRLVEKKAPQLTISAFAQVCREYPKAHLDIVGDGPLLQTCRDAIERDQLSDRVTLHGAQPSERVRELMQESLIFAQHSITAADGDTEGLPVSVLEAMSSALPVVATHHSGIPEAVADGQTGLLVNERDVAAMANAFRVLLDAPDKARNMGDRGRERLLQQFTRERMSERLRSGMRL